MRSRSADGGPGAVRDLIEAGLNEPADARATYGISVARLASDEGLAVMLCQHAREDEAETSALTEVIDALSGVFWWAWRNTSTFRAGRQRCRAWGLLASVGADPATLPGSMLRLYRMVMRYPAAVVPARGALAAAWR